VLAALSYDWACSVIDCDSFAKTTPSRSNRSPNSLASLGRASQSGRQGPASLTSCGSSSLLASYPVVSLTNGVPIQALREASQWRHPSLRPLPADAFFVALGGYMVAHFGLSDVPRDALLLVDPAATPLGGDLVLADSPSMGYQILAAQDTGGQLELVSLGIKLAHLGPISDAVLIGVVLESVSILNLRGFALRKSPQLLFAQDRIVS
jgi:hypothetical protein